MNTTSAMSKFLSSLVFAVVTLASFATRAADHSPFEDISLNQIWVNKSGEKANYVCESEEELLRILSGMQKWRAKNPNMLVNFWFDSEAVAQNAVEDIKIIVPSPLLEGITFSDIRTLDLVRNYPWAFSTKVSFYPKMDALRFAIARNYLQKPGAPRYFAYGDVAATAVSLPKLIEESQEDLDQHGILMANAEGFVHELTDHALSFENGFMIIDKNKTDLLDAIEDVMLASFFRFTETEENLPFLEPEAIYKLLGSFLLAYCNRNAVALGVGDWNAKFYPLDFNQRRFGVPLEIWTRNFFFAPNLMLSMAGVEKLPVAIPTVKQQILRASQFIKEHVKVPLTTTAVANFILQAEELDGVAFAQRFEREDMVAIITQSATSQGDKLKIIARYKHKAY